MSVEAINFALRQTGIGTPRRQDLSPAAVEMFAEEAARAKAALLAYARAADSRGRGAIVSIEELADTIHAERAVDSDVVLQEALRDRGGTPEARRALALGVACHVRDLLETEGYIRLVDEGQRAYAQVDHVRPHPAPTDEHVVYDVAVEEETVRLWRAIASEREEREMDASLVYNGYGPTYKPLREVEEFLRSLPPSTDADPEAR